MYKINRITITTFFDNYNLSDFAIEHSINTVERSKAGTIFKLSHRFC